MRTTNPTAPLADRLHRVNVEAKSTQGFVSAAQLERQGFSRTGVTRLVQRGLVERVAPGWYRSTALPWTYDDRVRQASILIGPEGAVGATTALYWFGVGDRPVDMCLVVPRGLRPRVRDRKLIQSTDLTQLDITAHRSIRVTTPTRSLIDAARLVPVRTLHRLVSDSVERSLTSEAMLAQRFLEVARAGRPGVRVMRRVLATRTDLMGPTATTFEQDFERIIARAGFPKPIRQYEVHCDGRRYRLDHAWPEFGCWTECDSMLAHSSPEQLAADLERQNRIIASTGLVPLRFTYRDVHERPGYVVDRSATLLPQPQPLVRVFPTQA